jgi:hypothetical protein
MPSRAYPLRGCLGGKRRRRAHYGVATVLTPASTHRGMPWSLRAARLVLPLASPFPIYAVRVASHRTVSLRVGWANVCLGRAFPCALRFIPHSPSHKGNFERFRGTGRGCMAVSLFARSSTHRGMPWSLRAAPASRLAISRVHRARCVPPHCFPEGGVGE